MNRLGKLSIGDRVEIETGESATVVFSTIRREFSKEYSESEWGNMEPGVMFLMDNGARFFLRQSDELKDDSSYKTT